MIPAQTPAQDFHFDGSISRSVLQNYLSRAIHMENLCTGQGDTEDNIRMLKAIGAKFAGRVIVIWGRESRLPERMQQVREIASQIHAGDPDVVLEGAILEYVSSDVNQLPIPAYVFEDLDLPVETRNFNNEDMLFLEPPRMLNLNIGHVPDITRQETRLWFYFLATSYIDAGLEAIHWGWFESMSGNDAKVNYANYFDVLTRVRLYAKAHARRHFILCNADAWGGVEVDGDLLFDFHSGNLHANGMREVDGRPQECELTGRYKSGGGLTPSGWSCERLPYLVHVDSLQ